MEYGPTNLIVDIFESDKLEIFEKIELIVSNKLSEIASELDKLKQKSRYKTNLKSDISILMNEATKMFLPKFITPMAAVAGSISEYLIKDVILDYDLKKISINNGGDAALYLKKNEKVKILIKNEKSIKVTLEGINKIYGVATSGWKGRSLSLGIADSVTTIANSSAIADAASTMIANEINLINHPNIKKKLANEIDHDTDLKNNLVTVDVGNLEAEDIEKAVQKGIKYASKLINNKLIYTAIINIKNNYFYIGKKFQIEHKIKKINFI